MTWPATHSLEIFVGSERGVGLGETVREKVGEDGVGDDDIGAFEPVSGENDAVQLWLQRLRVRKGRERDFSQEKSGPASVAVTVPSLEAIPALPLTFACGKRTPVRPPRGPRRSFAALLDPCDTTRRRRRGPSLHRERSQSH
jgi:hypothetical protein